MLESIQFSGHEVSELFARLDQLEGLIRDLSQPNRRRQPDPKVISWADVAVSLGIKGKDPAKAARARILRERKRPDGVPIRLVYGGVNRQDFESYFQAIQARHTSEGEAIRSAVNSINGSAAR